MKSGPPNIGVTGPDQGGAASWLFTRLAVGLAGGRAIRITPSRRRTIDQLHGLIIGGGADVSPSLYGHDPAPIIPRAREHGESRLLYLALLVMAPLTWLARRIASKVHQSSSDVARDELETTLIREAVAARLPILGICRGAQLLNVHFGGTLHQTLTGFYVEDPETRTFLPRKRIQVMEGSRLADIIGLHPNRVNALHKQAIDRLGRCIQISARDRNGIVQAIEHESLPFLIGVQWHPEYLPQVPEQRRLFCELVAQARTVIEDHPQAVPAH